MGEAGGAAAAQLTLLQQEAGYRVRDHFSGALAFAPIPSSSRSVVARSAAMPFWSCAIDLTPFADLGSLSMFRSFLFRRQSEIAFRSMVPHIEFGAMCRDTRLFGVLLPPPDRRVAALTPPTEPIAQMVECKAARAVG